MLIKVNALDSSSAFLSHPFSRFWTMKYELFVLGAWASRKLGAKTRAASRGSRPNDETFNLPVGTGREGGGEKKISGDRITFRKHCSNYTEGCKCLDPPLLGETRKTYFSSSSSLFFFSFFFFFVFRTGIWNLIALVIRDSFINVEEHLSRRCLDRVFTIFALSRLACRCMYAYSPIANGRWTCIEMKRNGWLY